MTDVAAQQQTTASPVAATPAKKTATAGAAKKAKNPRSKPTHPPTSEMVNGAIKSLKERGCSSLQAIKKYIAVNYKVDAKKMSPFIKKYLKADVASGALVQTKGKGPSGSFKLATSKKNLAAGGARDTAGASRSGSAAAGTKKKTAESKAGGARSLPAEQKSVQKPPPTKRKVSLQIPTRPPSRKRNQWPPQRPRSRRVRPKRRKPQKEKT